MHGSKRVLGYCLRSLLLYLLNGLPLSAQNGCMAPTSALPFIRQHESGWHWYQSPNTDPSPDTPYAHTDALSTARAHMHAYRQNLTGLLDQAILSPTNDHIQAWLQANYANQAMARAFSAAWQRALRTRPEWDPSARHPTANSALFAQNRLQHAQQIAKMRTIAQRYQLLYFYLGNCPYTAKMQPVLETLQTYYQLSIQPLRVGPPGAHDLPQSRPDHGEHRALNLHYFPSLWARNRQTQAPPVFIGSGWMDAQTVLDRLIERVPLP